MSIFPKGVDTIIAPFAPPYGLDGLPTLATTNFYPAKVFSPPSTTDTPLSLYSIKKPTNWCMKRFIRNTDPHEILIYTDGACLDNGGESPKAGCGIVFSTTEPERSGSLSFRLEAQGPTGIGSAQTSNRAELRAAIAALQYRVWYGEGARRIVIATDSSYVVSGITQWIHSWMRNGWRTSSGSSVKNRDLWELLIAEVSRYHDEGMRVFGETVEVLFWHIPRSLNTEADALAKSAAAQEQRGEFSKVTGVMI